MKKKKEDYFLTSRFSLTILHICFSRLRVSFKSVFLFIQFSYEILIDFGRERAENLYNCILTYDLYPLYLFYYLFLFIFQVRPLLGLPFGIAFNRSFSFFVDASEFILQQKIQCTILLHITAIIGAIYILSYLN